MHKWHAKHLLLFNQDLGDALELPKKTTLLKIHNPRPYLEPVNCPWACRPRLQHLLRWCEGRNTGVQVGQQDGLKTEQCLGPLLPSPESGGSMATQIKRIWQKRCCTTPWAQASQAWQSLLPAFQDTARENLNATCRRDPRTWRERINLCWPEFQPCSPSARLRPPPATWALPAFSVCSDALN